MKYLKLLPVLLTLALLAGVPAAVSGQTPVNVKIEHSTYTVAENAGTLAIAVTMSGTLSSSVSVGMETISGTADGAARFTSLNDFEPLTKTLTFPAGTKEQTVSITIIDDQWVEVPYETFSVALLSSIDSRITVETTPSVITITDDDTGVAWEGVTGDVLENTSFELCAVVEGVDRQPFTVSITFSDPGDALATGQTVPSSLMFDTGVTRKCFTLATGDIEGYPVFVSFILTGTDDDEVRIGNSYETVVVYDPDLPISNVRLESATYSGSEDTGSVEIRATIDRPLNQSIQVRLSSSDGTAVSAHDYDSILTTLRFKAGDATSSPVTVRIRDDNIMEAPRETFSVSLDRGSDPRFRVDTSFSTVIIEDNDGVVVGLERSNYSVRENLGANVSVCARIFGTTRVGVPISLRLSYSDPGGALSPAPADPSPLTFQAGDTRQCMNLSIGEVAAMSEVAITLKTPTGLDPRVTLQGTEATIVVFDSGRLQWNRTEDFDTLGAARNTSPQGIWSDGTTMWVADDESNKIYAYSLSTKQRQGSDDFDTLNAAENTSPRGLWSDDETMWVADEADAKIYSYNLASKAREDTKEFDTSSSDGNSSPQGIWSAAVVHNVAALDRPRSPAQARRRSSSLRPLFKYGRPAIPLVPNRRPHCSGCTVNYRKKSGPRLVPE